MVSRLHQHHMNIPHERKISLKAPLRTFSKDLKGPAVAGPAVAQSPLWKQS